MFSTQQTKIFAMIQWIYSLNSSSSSEEKWLHTGIFIRMHTVQKKQSGAFPKRTPAALLDNNQLPGESWCWSTMDSEAFLWLNRIQVLWLWVQQHTWDGYLPSSALWKKRLNTSIASTCDCFNICPDSLPVFVNWKNVILMIVHRNVTSFKIRYPWSWHMVI